eukprot:10869783-Ditylum_brightwellii.AAC.1
MNLYAIDYMGYPEINLDTMQEKVKSTLKILTHAIFMHLPFKISSLTIPAKHQFKPGGTMCILQGDINSCKIPQGCDKYGCWSYLKFLTASNIIITMITAYQLCHASNTIGTITYHQQLALHQINTTISVNPCKFFIKDFHKWMLAGHSKGKRFILAGDFNKILNSTSSMIKFCANKTLHIVDTLGNLTNTSFSTTKSGKNRIDYMLMLPELTTAV